MASRPPKLFVIGLDCAAPELVFDTWRSELPNLDRLIARGAYGRLRSCIPCITVPAWSVMTCGKDPGVLGIYGFRNRADYSYDKLSIATGLAVKDPRVWDVLGEHGKRVVMVGVPGTYPPRPVNGVQVGCFLTPGTVSRDEAGEPRARIFTYPPELSAEINAWAGGEYPVDVKDFRTENKADLLRQIYETTAQRFEVVRRLMRREAWDFFMFVEMGVDRIHHGFWRFFDEKHPKHEPGSPYQHAIHDYYRAVDREIGTLLALLDNDTSVMVVSDHGARTMLGGICVNEWLRREGYLALAGKPPASPTALDKLQVDWSRTRAWGEGGYYARVFLNVAGREPQGVVKPKDYERVRDEVAAGLKAIRGPRGEDLGTVIYKPHDIYRKVRGIPPDLLVYFGDLAWRSVGSLGHSEVWTLENDTGPDEANHARDGLFIYADPQRNLGGRELEGLEIMDVASTILAHYGLSVPGDMQGRRIAL